MFKANERCYNRTFGLYGLETLNHRSELKILWIHFDRRSQNFGFHMIAGSQMIAEDRTWFYLLRSEPCSIFCDLSSAIVCDQNHVLSSGDLSSAIVCDHDRKIAGDRRSVFPYDRRRSQNFLRSAICDRLRSYGNQPLKYTRL